MVESTIDGKNIEMEIDCGAALTIIPFKLFNRLFPDRIISQSTCKLSSVSGKINVKGQVMVTVTKSNVRNNQNSFVLPLIICTEENFIPLLGRNWLDKLAPD